MSDAVLQAVIQGHARQLRTPTIARECEAVARRARDEGWPYEEYLRFQQFQEKDILGRFDRLIERMAAHNEAYTEAEVEDDIRKARARGRAR